MQSIVKVLADTLLVDLFNKNSKCADISKNEFDVMMEAYKKGINGKSRLVNLVLLPLWYGNKDIIRDDISECHR